MRRAGLIEGRDQISVIDAEACGAFIAGAVESC